MEELKNAKRIVFKFGTNVLRNENGEISLSRIYSFIEEISKLHKAGKEVIIVTSGAVGLGAKKANVNPNENISLKQACAAIGQGQLISIYENGFASYGINTAQILLTEDDFTERVRYLSLSNVLETLLKLKVVPVINQNDTVSVKYYTAIISQKGFLPQRKGTPYAVKTTSGSVAGTASWPHSSPVCSLRALRSRFPA